MPLTVPIELFGAAIRQRIEGDADELHRIALNAANHGVQFAVQLTDELGLVDQEFYKLSWGYSDTPAGIELGNTAPYSPVIEHGRRPGQPGPPVIDERTGRNPILDWVVRKLVANGEVDATDAESVAFAIRQAIHDRGTPPRKVLQQALEEVRAYIEREAPRRLQRG